MTTETATASRPAAYLPLGNITMQITRLAMLRDGHMPPRAGISQSVRFRAGVARLQRDLRRVDPQDVIANRGDLALALSELGDDGVAAINAALFDNAYATTPDEHLSRALYFTSLDAQQVLALRQELGDLIGLANRVRTRALDLVS